MDAFGIHKVNKYQLLFYFILFYFILFFYFILMEKQRSVIAVDLESQMSALENLFESVVKSPLQAS